MFVSNNPPTIAVSLSKKGYSGELIRNTGEFALNIVGENLKETGFLCGTCSGRKEEKAEKFGISLIPAQKVLPEVIQDSKAVMECKFVGEYSATDHNIFVGEIIEIHFDPKQKQLFAWNGYGELGTVSKNN